MWFRCKKQRPHRPLAGWGEWRLARRPQARMRRPSQFAAALRRWRPAPRRRAQAGRTAMETTVEQHSRLDGRAAPHPGEEEHVIHQFASRAAAADVHDLGRDRLQDAHAARIVLVGESEGGAADRGHHRSGSERTRLDHPHQGRNAPLHRVLVACRRGEHAPGPRKTCAPRAPKRRGFVHASEWGHPPRR